MPLAYFLFTPDDKLITYKFLAENNKQARKYASEYTIALLKEEGVINAQLISLEKIVEKINLRPNTVAGRYTKVKF
jgi:hypothetical protein